MPRKGYRSITVPNDVYEFFKNEWLKNKDQLRRRGVRSFSGYVTSRLNQLMEEEEKKHNH
jgi:hypothetical protein